MSALLLNMMTTPGALRGIVATCYFASMSNMDDRRLTADEVVKMMGGPVAAATTLGIKHSSVCRWVREDRIPVDRVPSVAAVTGLPRWKLPHQRPDLFPKA